MSTATAPSVLYDVRDHVACVTLNRPYAANAVDLGLARHLRDAVLRADGDPDARVVLLSGAGKIFCAGGDLTAMAAAPDRPAFLAELAATAHSAVRAMHDLSKPLIAAVQGSVAGVGFSLALGADMVIAARSAAFITAYTSVGLTPDGGLSWLLPRAIGQQRALELLMTSRPLPADQAQALGIVSDVRDDTDLAEAARAVAARLAARPAHALGQARRLVRSSWAHTLDEHLDVEADTITRVSAGPEAAELIAGFVDRACARSEERTR
jgi:2-(1,2-epoxy-1,2-dihydrophenyl)acetyl-CoA isomerase